MKCLLMGPKFVLKTTDSRLNRRILNLVPLLVVLPKTTDMWIWNAYLLKKRKEKYFSQFFFTSLGNRGWSDGACATYYPKSIFQHRHAWIHWSRGLSDRCLWKNKFSSASNTNLRHFFLSKGQLNSEWIYEDIDFPK